MGDEQVQTVSSGRLTRRQRAQAIYPLVVRLGELWDEYLRLFAQQNSDCPNGARLIIVPAEGTVTAYPSEELAVIAEFFDGSMNDQAREVAIQAGVTDIDTRLFVGDDRLCVYQRSSYGNALLEVSLAGEGQRFWISGGEGVEGIPSSSSSLPSFQGFLSTQTEFTNLPIFTGDLDVGQFALVGNYSLTGGRHPGFDFFAPPGTPVLAAADGVVIGYYNASQDVYVDQDGFQTGFTREMSPSDPRGRPILNDFSSGQRIDDPFLPIPPSGLANYGRDYIVVQHGDVIAIYAHLESGSANVGDRVFAGQPIATVGHHGGGPHLHIETRIFGSSVQLEADGYPHTGSDYSTRPLVFLDPVEVFDENVQRQIIPLTEFDRLTVAITPGGVLHQVPSADPTIRAQQDEAVEAGTTVLYQTREDALNAVRPIAGPTVIIND